MRERERASASAGEGQRVRAPRRRQRRRPRARRARRRRPRGSRCAAPQGAAAGSRPVHARKPTRALAVARVLATSPDGGGCVCVRGESSLGCKQELIRRLNAVK
eukprot:5441397-Pleurochrysis_carterae.AAC.1